MSKQASTEDDAACIHRINSDVTGLSYKVENFKAGTNLA